MTLEEIKTGIQDVALSHKDITSFAYGEDALVATGKGAKYPRLFLELPYNATYELDNNRYKTFQFAVLVLMTSTSDNLKEDHIAISRAEVVGDAIIRRVQALLPDLKLDSVTGVSLREFSDDNASGFRFDITAKTFRACYNGEDFNK